jgi:hypothetical protein
VFQEVVDPHEPAADVLLNFHSDLMTTNRNAAFSQPYYSRHAVTHLRRGEAKPFLSAYYNTVAALADRETYTSRSITTAPARTRRTKRAGS